MAPGGECGKGFWRESGRKFEMSEGYGVFGSAICTEEGAIACLNCSNNSLVGTEDWRDVRALSGIATLKDQAGFSSFQSSCS